MDVIEERGWKLCSLEIFDHLKEFKSSQNLSLIISMNVSRFKNFVDIT